MSWKRGFQIVVYGISAIFIAHGLTHAPFMDFIFSRWYAPIIVGGAGFWFAWEKLRE